MINKLTSQTEQFQVRSHLIVHEEFREKHIGGDREGRVRSQNWGLGKENFYQQRNQNIKRSESCREVGKRNKGHLEKNLQVILEARLKSANLD